MVDSLPCKKPELQEAKNVGEQRKASIRLKFWTFSFFLNLIESQNCIVFRLLKYRKLEKQETTLFRKNNYQKWEQTKFL